MRTSKYFGNDVGERIKALRLRQGIKQEDLARKAAITTKYMSLIETGQREASIHVYRCIAQALCVPLWQLFCSFPDEALLVLNHFDDCSTEETRALSRFIAGNKIALRQHHSLDLGLYTKMDSHS